jgi:hypothetical protein
LRAHRKAAAKFGRKSHLDEWSNRGLLRIYGWARDMQLQQVLQVFTVTGNRVYASAALAHVLENVHLSAETDNADTDVRFSGSLDQDVCQRE